MLLNWIGGVGCRKTPRSFVLIPLDNIDESWHSPDYRKASRMAYPEPITSLKGRQAEQFLRDLEDFRLTKKQIEFYKDAINRKDKD